jgi:hypothetical protein
MSVTGVYIGGSNAGGQSFEGVNSVTSLASIPTDKPTVYAEIAANQSLSIGSGLGEGRTIHVVAKNNARGDTTIGVIIPTTGNYVSMDGSSISIAAGAWIEIFITCVVSSSTNPIYFISIKQPSLIISI